MLCDLVTIGCGHSTLVRGESNTTWEVMTYLGLYWHLGLQNAFPRCRDCKSKLCLFGAVYQAIEPLLDSRGYQLALQTDWNCLLCSCCCLSGILVWFCCCWDARLKAGLVHRYHLKILNLESSCSCWHVGCRYGPTWCSTVLGCWCKLLVNFHSYYYDYYYVSRLLQVLK